MKCKQSEDVSILAQKYSPVFKKTAVNSERVTQESYIKLISWVAVYSQTKMTVDECKQNPTCEFSTAIFFLNSFYLSRVEIID